MRWIADEGDIWEVDADGNRKRWVGRLNPKDARKVVEEGNLRADLDAARAAHAELWVERNALLRGLAAERAARAEAEAARAAMVEALEKALHWAEAEEVSLKDAERYDADIQAGRAALAKAAAVKGTR